MKLLLPLLLLALAVPATAQPQVQAEYQERCIREMCPPSLSPEEGARCIEQCKATAVLVGNNAAIDQMRVNLEQARAQIENPPAFAPASYFVGAGVGLSRASDPLATGWMAAGMCFKSGTCPYTEFDNITGVTTTMQGGVMQRLAKSGNLTLYALGQIGGATTDGSLTAVFSGGFLMNYSRPKWNGLGIVMPVKAVKVNGANVNLTIAWGVSKSF